MASSINASTSGAGGVITTADNTGILNLQTGGTTVVTIDTSQNVGIGTTSPARQAVIYGSFPCLQLTNSTSGATSNDGLLIFESGLNATLSNQEAGYMSFETSNTERMRIDSSGNVGIGTSTTTYRLTVTGNIDNEYVSQISNSNTTAGRNYGLRILAGSNVNDTAFRIANYTNTSTLFLVAGNGRTYIPEAYTSTTGNSANLFVDTDGRLIRATSSLKYKTDVQDATHGLNEVMQLRSVTYKGKEDGDKIFGGLIAEEVHEAGLTEFVQYAQDGTPDALAYGNMVSLLTKAIQEQQTIINDLKARIETLEAK